MKFLVAKSGVAAGADKDVVYMFNLTSPFDVSTCSFSNETTNLDSAALQEGSNAGDPDPTGGGA